MTIASGLSLLFVSFSPPGHTRVLEDELPWDKILPETAATPVVLLAVPDLARQFVWLVDDGLPWLKSARIDRPAGLELDSQ